MANKYDITSGLTEYKSMYHDIGVDKYIDAVTSLRETHDKNIAGMNLVSEGVQQMEFMPGDDQIGRAYLSDNVNGILEGAMNAPEEASMQVNKAAQFFTSDPTASAYRRNAKEFALTKEIAMNTPGGWSSMIMFGNNPFEFQTVNPDDGSINQYIHQAEGRLDHERKFLDMVGTIAKDTSIFGPEFQDITGDNIADILSSGSSTGVSNRKADKIVDGVMEQYINTAEGRQAMRELMESVGGQPPVTDDREEAKSMLLQRLRPLIQNQVGFTRSMSSSQISGNVGGGGGGDDLFGSSPSILLGAITGDVTKFDNQLLTQLGYETGKIASTSTMLTDYASVLNLGYLGDVEDDYAIVPGFKPFENLDGNQKIQTTLALMDVLDLVHADRNTEAMELAKTIPGFSEAVKTHGNAVMEGLETYYQNVSKLGIAETRESLGVLLNMSINGGKYVQLAEGAEVKSINRGGETVVGIRNRVFITKEQLDQMAINSRGTKSEIGKPGAQFFSFLPGGEANLWATDIDDLRSPGTGKKIFEKGEYGDESGYFVDVWTERPVEVPLQERVDTREFLPGSAKERADIGYKNQIKQYGALTKHFQQYKQAYVQDGSLWYVEGMQTIDGMQQPKIQKINIGKYVGKNTILDLKIRNMFDLMPEASIGAQMTQGTDNTTFTNSIMTRVRMIVTAKQSDKAKQDQVQELIDYIKSIKTK